MPKFKSLSDIRRSLKGDMPPPPPPTRLNAGVPSAAIPPKKVIKALYDFSAESPNELSFRAGDFFHVIGNENDMNWYEAFNPLTNARGMVPVKYFQELGRQATSPISSTPPTLPAIDSNMSRMSNIGEITGNDGRTDSGFGSQPPRTSPPNSSSQQRGDMGHKNGHSSSGSLSTGPQGEQRGHRSRPSVSSNASGSGSGQLLHGVVLYDFMAERPNELGAHTGDNIIIVAQSHKDWFVAKFINRIGGPGLIPVSYVDVYDPETNQPTEDLTELMRRLQITLPTVEEWKRMMVQQERDGGDAGGMVSRHQRGASNVSHRSHGTQGSLGGGTGMARKDSYGAQYPSSEIVIAAGIDSYITQEDQFWFLIRLDMMDGSQRTVYRIYEDFHSFQIALLNNFPEEAGRTGRRRILPFMPAPVSIVDENVTAERCGFLDIYIKELCAVPEYIRNSKLVRRFFGIEEGDDDDDEELEPPSMGGGGGHQRTGSNASASGGRRVSPPNSSGGNTGTAGDAASMLKVKLMYNDDLIAIRVPANITYVALWEKVFERLGSSVKAVSWKTTAGEWQTLDSEEDLRAALAETAGKLTLHAT